MTGEVPGSPVFVMQLAPVCRHLEVQLVADEGGNALALFGRDCSVQRRHQKIIEEGPAVAALPAVWRQMELSAIRLAKKVGYTGAGTPSSLPQRERLFFYFFRKHSFALTVCGFTCCLLSNRFSYSFFKLLFLFIYYYYFYIY